MTLENNTQFVIHKYTDNNGVVDLYHFFANEGYCFRNNAEPLIDEEGNIYFDHSTAFALFAKDINKLADYDCIQIEDNFIIH